MSIGAEGETEITINKGQVDEKAWGTVEYSYSNHTQTTGSNWDVRFVFSERLPGGEVRPKAGVVMSHAHAKALLGALQKTIAAIEKLMGQEIRHQPPGISVEIEDHPMTQSSEDKRV